ncbi:hypothetical protein [Tateyamaria sp. ANG-S1]|uniref:hypothetical protein n=1 Tax=Tateyamaria sp. ANG-S1 TaxID=1577905 RepID=UPI00057E8FB1|nr:hypothetical protein [Tateyamaria sp. ANG-S1]KIC47778.1 hypothetical protein RA29_19050 [Tateyamaria sp. ANG-S1]
MAKVILHIGTHKTATTTIQDTFHANAALLAEHGVIYPKLTRFSGHHGLVSDWNKLPEIYHIEGGSRAALAHLNAKYADTEHTVFLSSEEFSRGDPNAAVDFTEVRALLSGFDEIEVVCVLRAQWQFLQSIYMERSKVSSPPRPPYFVQQALDNNLVEGLWTDYNRILDVLLKTFDASEITLLDYGTAVQEKGGILGVFLRHFGVSLSVEDLTPVNAGKSNVSPLPLAAWAANIVAEPERAPEWLIEMMTTVLKNSFGQDMRCCLFTQHEFNQLHTHFTDLNRQLYARLANRQPDFCITGMEDARLGTFRQHVHGDFWLRCTRRMTFHKMGFGEL